MLDRFELIVFSWLLIMSITTSDLALTITPLSKYVERPEKILQPHASIVCAIHNATSTVKVRWLTSNGIIIGPITMANSKTSSNKFHASLYQPNKTVLTIFPLNYRDAGIYTCEAAVGQLSGPDNWVSANITLVLRVFLNVTNGLKFTIYNNVSSFELSCDMNGYIPEDTALKWYRNNILVTSMNNNRVSTSYRPGQRLAARNDSEVMNSTEGVLTFTPPHTTDSGTYECRISGFEFLSPVLIELEVEESPNITGIHRPGPSPSMNSLLSDRHSFATDYISTTQLHSMFPTMSTSVDTDSLGIVASVIVSIVIAVMLLLVLIFIGLFCYKKKNQSRNEVKNTEAKIILKEFDNPIYGTITEDYEEISATDLIDKSKLKLIEQLDEGAFAVLYRGVISFDQSTAPTAVTVKTVKSPFKQSDVDNIITEALTMKSFNHPNILSLTGICLDLKEAPCIVTPLMNEGTLLSYLKREKQCLIMPPLADELLCSEAKNMLLSLCLHVANGMAYLTQQKFVHKSLSTSSCMVSSDGVVRITFADGVSEETDDLLDCNDPSRSRMKLMALETIRSNTFTEKSDVWSFGVLCWEVFSSGSPPYPTMSPKEVISALNEGKRLEKPSNAACTDEIYLLMSSCWNAVPQERPTFADLVIHYESFLTTPAEYSCSSEAYSKLSR